MDTLRILLVDDRAERRELLKIVLDAAVDGCYVDVVGDPVSLGEVLRSGPPSAVVVGHPTGWLDGFELVDRLRTAFPDRPLVLVVDAAGEAVASAALRLGAADLVVHDDSAPLRVRDAVARVLAEAGLLDRRREDRRGAPPEGRRRTRSLAPPPGPRSVPGDDPTATATAVLTDRNRGLRATRRGARPRIPPAGLDPEPLPPTTPGTPTPMPIPAATLRSAPDPTDVPTAAMTALDRKLVEAPTEVGRPGLKELVEKAAVGWFRCDPDGIVVDANDAFLAIMEAKRGDVRLSRLGLTKTRWKGLVKEIRKSGAASESGLELKSVLGTRRVGSLTLRGASLGKDKPVVDGLLVDTTDLETARGDRGDVIELDTRRKKAEADAVEEATMIERDRLIGLSHDLQEPLRTVRIYADLLEEKHSDSLTDEAKQMLQRSREAAQRMEEMVSDLVEEATLELRPEARTADCARVLTGVLGNLAAAVDDSGAEISHDELPVVALPPSQMAQLLQNLVGNAIKYRSDDPPKIHVGAERGNGEWIFSVTDNGMGIPDEFQARVFEMFERGTDAESLPGSGIGLAVCRRVVESHGGRIWVESTPGDGSTFQFTVPAAASAAEETA